MTDKWGAKRKRKLFKRREEQTQCVVGVTDKWGAKRKRKFFKRREEQTQWVVGMTDKYRGKRERGCYLVGQRADMIIWSAQPKISESLHQIFSQSLTENFKKKMFYKFVSRLISAKPTK